MTKQIAVICLGIAIISGCDSSAATDKNSLELGDGVSLASQFDTKSDYSNLQDHFLVAVSSEGEKPQSPLFVGPNYPFDPGSPENKLGSSPTNWGYYGSGDRIEGTETMVPEIVSHIATETMAESDIFVNALIARSGESIYLPIRRPNGTWYAGIEDLGEYKIFDVSTLKYRNVTPPRTTYQQYEVTTEGLGSTRHGFGSIQVRDVYKWLQPAISPNGKLGARVVWALDTKAQTLHDAVVIWDLSTGEIQRLIKLPLNFFMATYKSVTSKCPDANERLFDAACLYYGSGQAFSVKPSTPFFVSETEVMLPLVYLKSPGAAIIDSMHFLFQRLDLTKEDQRWDLIVEKDNIRILTDATFLYAKVDHEKSNAPDLTSEDLTRSFSYSSVASQFSNPNGYLAFPVFSATVLGRSLVSLLSDYKRIDDGDVPFINPKPLPLDTEGKLGTKVVITGTGDFGYAYSGKRRRSGLIRQYFSIDGKAEVPTLPMTSGFSNSLPSFFPSIYQPTFSYRDSYLSQQTWTYGANVYGQGPFPGTELIAVWSDPSLPKGHYFAKLSSKSQFYDSYEDLKGKNKARIDSYEGLDFSSKPESDSSQYWRYATLAVVKFQSTDLMKPTGVEKCQAIAELNIEICNQIQYALKERGKLLSGNFHLKNGEKLLLKQIGVEENGSAEGCWYKSCQQTETRKLSVEIPGHTGVTLNIKKIATHDCTYSSAGRSCGPSTYVVSGTIKKRKPGVDETAPEEKKYDTYKLNIFLDGEADTYKE